MFITKKHLHRRTFLRGLGTALALPMLDAMVPALAATPRSPFRFGAVYMPNGVYPQLWHPQTTAGGFAFQRIMKPLEPYRSHLVTISRMKAPDGNKDMGGIHMGASAAFLNGMGPIGKNGDFNLIESRKSVDQYIADAVAEDTPLRSIEVGTEDMGTAAGARRPSNACSAIRARRSSAPRAGRRSRACSIRLPRKPRACAARSARPTTSCSTST
jgi:hypothetical protein